MTHRDGVSEMADATSPPAGSYCRVLRAWDNHYAVEAYQPRPSGDYHSREVWCGRSEGRAMLVAQFLATRGYRLANHGRRQYASS